MDQQTYYVRSTTTGSTDSHAVVNFPSLPEPDSQAPKASIDANAKSTRERYLLRTSAAEDADSGRCSGP